MKLLPSLLILLLGAAATHAEDQRPEYRWPSIPQLPSTQTLTDRQILRLYPAKPGEGDANSSAQTPGMEVFLPPPATATGKAIILVPGGSYHHITAAKIFTVAENLRGQGATVFVLFYRYGTTHPWPAPGEDGARAVRIVRAFATAWKLDPKAITMIGASAAGHLVGWVATTGAPGSTSTDPIERQSSRPDLVALISPVISMREDWSGTRGNTLPAGTDATKFGEQFSIDLKVTKNTPPMFIWHANDDKAVKAAVNSGLMAAALAKAGVPCDYVNAPTGGHVGGWDASWGMPLNAWLAKQGVLRTATH